MTLGDDRCIGATYAAGLPLHLNDRFRTSHDHA
jgi:hypothetical protein